MRKFVITSRISEPSDIHFLKLVQTEMQLRMYPSWYCKKKGAQWNRNYPCENHVIAILVHQSRSIKLCIGEILRICESFSSKTLAIRLKELQKAGILERQAFNQIPPKVEYRLTIKGQELVESIIGLLQWMRKWSNQSILHD